MVILFSIWSRQNYFSQSTFKQDNFKISISHTTRQPRSGEIPNKDYFFVNDNEFKRLIKNQEFLEFAKVFDNYYGTTRTPVIDNLKKVIMYFLILIGKELIKSKIKIRL